jgi:hypothetical protein
MSTLVALDSAGTELLLGVSGISTRASNAHPLAIQHHGYEGQTKCERQHSHDDEHIISAHTIHPRREYEDDDHGYGVANKSYCNQGISEDLDSIS